VAYFSTADHPHRGKEHVTGIVRRTWSGREVACHVQEVEGGAWRLRARQVVGDDAVLAGARWGSSGRGGLVLRTVCVMRWTSSSSRAVGVGGVLMVRPARACTRALLPTLFPRSDHEINRTGHFRPARRRRERGRRGSEQGGILCAGESVASRNRVVRRWRSLIAKT
jgi:hypothetical protein